MFWVPAEPWGWVPYHLGIWMWDAKKGWMWLPGSLFAPAWAVWDFYAGFYSWRPYSLFDWMSGFDGFWNSLYWYGSYSGFSPGRPYPSSPLDSPEVLRGIRKDQLKKKDSPDLPMPKEVKKAFEATLAALKRGDPSPLDSVEGLRQRSVFVKKQELLSPSWLEKAVPLERLAKELPASAPPVKPSSPPRSTEVSKEARLAIERDRSVADVRAWVASSSRLRGEAARPAAAPPSFRFRDWNPDTRTAIRMGVEISYSSRTNEIACPQLGLSSHNVRATIRQGGSVGGFSPSRGSSSGSNAGSTTGSSQGTGRTHSSGSSASQKGKH
jgi:hypothetical protein